MIKTSNIKPWRFNAIRSFITYGFLRDNVVLAGGSLRTFVDPRDCVKDFDLFFLGEETKEIKDKLEDEIKAKGGKKSFQCKEDELRSFELHGMKIQLISIKNKKYSSVEHLLDSFDINASRFALTTEGGYFYLHFTEQSVRDIKKKHITINTVTYPVATIKRICKFKEKGYNVTLAAKEFVQQVSKNSQEMDLETVYVD